jgi:hypothetical protein
MKPSIVLATKAHCARRRKRFLRNGTNKGVQIGPPSPSGIRGGNQIPSFLDFPKWDPILVFLLALAVILQPILYWFGFLSVGTLWVSAGTLLFIEAIFAAIFRDRVKATLEPLDSLSIELPTMSELLKIIEQEKFRSAKLKSSRPAP